VQPNLGVNQNWCEWIEGAICALRSLSWAHSEEPLLSAAVYRLAKSKMNDSAEDV
jgi:hypothetical protein